MNTENGAAGSAGAFTLTEDNLYTVVPPWISMIGGLTQFERWVLTVLASFREGFWGSRQFLALRLGCDPESQRAQVSRAVTKLKGMGILVTVSEGRRQTLKLDPESITRLVRDSEAVAVRSQIAPVTEDTAAAGFADCRNGKDHSTSSHRCGIVCGENGGKIVDNSLCDRKSRSESVTNRHTDVTDRHISVTNKQPYIEEDLSVRNKCLHTGERQVLTRAFGVAILTRYDANGSVISARPCTPEEVSSLERTANDCAFRADAHADAGEKHTDSYTSSLKPLKVHDCGSSESLQETGAAPSSPLRPRPSRASALKAREEGRARFASSWKPPVPTADDVTSCLTDVYRLPYSDARDVAALICAHYTAADAGGRSRNWMRGYSRVTVADLPKVCRAWAMKWRSEHGQGGASQTRRRGGVMSRPASEMRDESGWYYPVDNVSRYGHTGCAEAAA